MASPSKDTWSDRRGLFQRGKDVHEPGKLANAGVVDAVRRASMTSNTSETAKPAATQTSSAGRRRSSGVQFENLTTLKRGSQDYGERRTSHSEMHGNGGVVSGWFNKTFRGMESSNPAANQTQQQDSRRGVMEWIEHRTDSV